MAIPPIFQPISRGIAARSGLSMIELMIAMAILSIVLVSSLSGFFSLRQSQRASNDETIAKEVAQSLSERVMGATWELLGRNRDVATDETQYAWSWHRRELKRNATEKVLLPPMTDRDWTAAEMDATSGAIGKDLANTSVAMIGPASCHNLIKQKLIDRQTGLRDLKVYLEYYHASALDGMFMDTDSQDFWKKTVNGSRGETDILPESPMVSPSNTPGEQMDLSESAINLKAIAIRILVTWTDQYGFTRRHELVLARRK